MATKTKHLTLELFNVPKDTISSYLTIEHPSIASWDLKSIEENKGEYVAYLSIVTNDAVSPEDFVGEIAVSASNHEVVGADIFINADEDDSISFSAF